MYLNWMYGIIHISSFYFRKVMRMYQSDTIAAIATALSDSGIGIIRVSGDDAVDIVDRIFYTKSGKRILKNVKSHTIHYGFICGSSGFENKVNDKESNKECSDLENSNPKNCYLNDTDKCNFEEKCNNIDGDLIKETIIDEVMVSVFLAPKSYTAENTVEINCHGGIFITQKVLETVIKAGARLAQPGEFTKRAFLNGRVDLSKAEAVMDIIHSQNEYALKASINQLKGSLSNKIKELRQEIIYEIAFIESALDDPEHISLDGYPERISKKLDYLTAQIQILLDTAENGRIVREGISTVIVGKPNAGKSSLLNMILGQDRAIVTDIAGTTRDVLEESVQLKGIHLNMIDTAGIRDTEDAVEKIGVEKARKYASEADLILYVVDSSVELDDNDSEIMGIIKNKRIIFLLNKSDLEQKTGEEEIKSYAADSENFSVIRTSAKENKGLDELEKEIENLIFQGAIQSNDEILITNLRHKEALQEALYSLNLVKKSVEDDMPEDFLSIDLMSAYASLGSIIGEEVGDDLVEEIFSKFCMGK